MKSLCALLICLMSVGVAAAQSDKMTSEQYIAKYKDLAISEMKRTGIPASITLAQGLLESGNGNSYLAKEAKNHFGIKCKAEWTGRSVKLTDDAPDECFRAYDKVEDSYRDHSDFLSQGQRYAFLFELEPTDYEGWAKGLKKAGYATNPKYADLLISAIERYQLFQYDVGNKRRVIPAPEEKKQEEVPVLAEKKTEVKQFVYNGIPAYVVKPGDTYVSISEDMKMMRWQVLKYNDLDKDDKLEPGTILYLKPKRRKAKEDETHPVTPGETMYYISQRYAVKLKLLYKRNLMQKGQEPMAGETVYLRKKRETPPALRTGSEIAKKEGVMVAKPKVAEQQVPKPAPKPVEKFADTLPITTVPQQTDSTKYLYTSTTLPKGDTLSADTATVPVEAAELQTAPVNLVQQPVKEEQPAATAEFHTVAQGESLYGIARAYGVSVQELRDWNNINDYSIDIGQQLRIKKETAVMEMPDGGQKIVDKSTQNATEGYYTVQAGETLYGISRKFGVTVASLREMNQLGTDALSTGQRLKVKEERSQAVSYHTVSTGESLFSIARKYGLTVDKLKEMNSLQDNSIAVGQKLKIKP